MTKRLDRGAIGWLAGTAVLCAAGVAGAEPIKPGQQQGLGLMGADVPDELKKISADPYAAPGDCEQINREIAMLDGILGPDRDSGQQAKTSMIGTTVMPLARSFIPYRNVVRFVTGANQKDAQLTQAAMAGWERRGFLKGLQKHCGQPDEAAFVTGTPAADVAPQPIQPQDLQVVAGQDQPQPPQDVATPDVAPTLAADASPPPRAPDAAPEEANYQSAAAEGPGR